MKKQYEIYIHKSILDLNMYSESTLIYTCEPLFITADTEEEILVLLNEVISTSEDLDVKYEIKETYIKFD